MTPPTSTQKRIRSYQIDPVDRGGVIDHLAREFDAEGTLIREKRFATIEYATSQIKMWTLENAEFNQSLADPTSTQQKAAHSEIHVPKDWADRAAREVSSTIVGQSSDRERRIAEVFRRHSPHEALVEALKLCEKQLDDCQRTFRDMGYPVTASVLDRPLEQARAALRQATA